MTPRAAAKARGLCLCGEVLAPDRASCAGCLADSAARTAATRSRQPRKLPAAEVRRRWMASVLAGLA